MQKLNNIVPIIVAYNSKNRENELLKSIDALTNIFNCIVFIDNNQNNDLFINFICNKNIHYIHNANRGGLAGGYNKALDYINNFLSDITYIIFIDDDTKINEISLSYYANNLISKQKETGVTAISGCYKDVNSGTYCNFIKLNRWYYKRIIKSNYIESVTFIINSMSIWLLKDLIILGKFNEELMVDHIDSDMCLRALESGFSINVDLSMIYNHEIGKRISYRFLNYKFNSGNHSINRRFMIGKATGFLFRSRLISWPAVSFLMIQRFFYEILGIILVENEKNKKIIAFVKGFFYGVVINYEKINNFKK